MLCALVLAHEAQAHRYLSKPEPRNLLSPLFGEGVENKHSLNGGFGNPDGINPAQYENANGHGLCGDYVDRKASFSDPSAPQGNAAKRPLVSYAAGGYMDLEVVLTAHHEGWFEFRLCVPGDGGASLLSGLTQECFNKHVLEMDVEHAVRNYGDNMKLRNGMPLYTSPSDYEGSLGWGANPWYDFDEMGKCTWMVPGNNETGGLPPPEYGSSRGRGHGPVGTCCNGGGDCSGAPKRWRVPSVSSYSSARPYKMRYKLPAGVAAERAVLQWTYQTSNSNSPQDYPETFWNCADIAILAGHPTAAPEPSPAPSTLTSSSPAPSSPAPSSPAPSTPVPIFTERPSSAAPTARPSPTGAPVPSPTTSAPAPTSSSCGCRSVSSVTTDLWCQQTGCDPVYVEGGFCQVDCGGVPALPPSTHAASQLA